MDTGVQFHNHRPTNVYYDKVHRQPHYIMDPKAYVSGAATDPPPKRLTQENIYTLCPIDSIKCYDENDSDSEISISDSSECIKCLAGSDSNSDSDSKSTTTNASTTIESTILLTQTAQQQIIQQIQSKLQSKSSDNGNFSEIESEGELCHNNL